MMIVTNQKMNIINLINTNILITTVVMIVAVIIASRLSDESFNKMYSILKKK